MAEALLNAEYGTGRADPVFFVYGIVNSVLLSAGHHYDSVS